ncbi:MAG: DUF2079 domain-containing protein [Chloroflexota bacterium]|nr:DUF2079 domain-containing protein [Dehalococcoidia bacterium]MDW8253567.1 DUF2079 domain-containing protein [Chloroflexota bacterium]
MPSSPSASPFASWPGRALIAATALAALSFAAFSLYRHATFNSGAFDLGIFDQVVWNSSQGRLFANTLSESRNFLGQHLSLILLLLVPLAWVGANAPGLLVVQAILLAAAALPIGWYALRRVGGWTALIIPVGYLIHPTLFATASFDFHEVAFAPLLLAVALGGLLTRRRLPFYGAALVLLTVREDMGIIAAGLGLWAAWRAGWRDALLLAGVGLLWTALAVLVVIPAFSDSGRYFYFWRFGALGDTPDAIGASLLTNPLAAVTTMLAPRKLLFLFELLVSWGGLPLAAPATLLLALPNLAYLLLGQYRPLTELISHYPVTLLPPLAFAAADGLAWMRHRLPRLAPLAAAASLAAMAVMAGMRLPETAARRLNNGLAGDTAHLRLAREMLRLIPPTASVSAQTGLVPHLSAREKIFLFPRYADAEFVALDTRAQRYAPPGSLTYEEGLEEVLCEEGWGPLFERDGLLLLRRGSGGILFPAAVPSYAQPRGDRFDDGLILEAVELPLGALRSGAVPRIVLYWRAEQRPSRDWTVFVHLVDAEGRVRGQLDAPPHCGDSPTSGWEPGRLLRDDIWIVPQRVMPPGLYRIVLGLYDPSTGARALSQGQEAIELGGLTVR